MTSLTYLPIGTYVPGRSLIHRLDPRTKVCVIFLFVIGILFANNVASYLIATGFVLLAMRLTKLPLGYLFKGFKWIAFILFLMFIFHLLLTKEGEPIYTLGWFSIYDQAVIKGSMVVVRLLLLILLASLLTLTTKPLDLTLGLERLFKPLKRVKFPAHEIAFMVSIAMRFIPTLIQELEKIMKAQRARGAQFGVGGITKRIFSFIPVVIPMFITAIQRAEDLALAMEARGYRGAEGRTQLRQLQMTTLDTQMMVLSGIIVIAMLFVRTWP